MSASCFALCVSVGPNTPFAFPILFWVDMFRVLVMAIGVIVIVLTPRLVIQALAVGQQCRLAAQGVFALIVVGTEVDQIGDFAHYRLILSFVGVSLMLYGLLCISKEIPPKTIDNK